MYRTTLSCAYQPESLSTEAKSGPLTWSRSPQSCLLTTPKGHSARRVKTARTLEKSGSYWQKVRPLFPETGSIRGDLVISARIALGNGATGAQRPGRELAPPRNMVCGDNMSHRSSSQRLDEKGTNRKVGGDWIEKRMWLVLAAVTAP